MTKVDDPRRLFESDAAPPELRDWLTRANADGLSDVAAARLVRAVEQSMSGAGPAHTEGAPWRLVTHRSRFAKLLSVAALAGLGGVLWHAQHRTPRPTPTEANGAPSASVSQPTARIEANGASSASVAQPTAAIREAESAGSATPLPTQEAVPGEPATPSATTSFRAQEAAVAPRLDSTVPSHAAVTPSVAPENGARLDDTPSNTNEFQLLRAARRAAATEPARALQLTDEHLRRFPQGVLSQEREAIAIESLVNLGRAGAATTRGKGFVTGYPNSPYRTRIEAALRRVSAPER